jgi:hypothetical protein
MYGVLANLNASKIEVLLKIFSQRLKKIMEAVDTTKMIFYVRQTTQNLSDESVAYLCKILKG